jgi:hypothetical protein
LGKGRTEANVDYGKIAIWLFSLVGSEGANPVSIDSNIIQEYQKT